MYASEATYEASRLSLSSAAGRLPHATHSSGNVMIDWAPYLLANPVETLILTKMTVFSILPNLAVYVPIV